MAVIDTAAQISLINQSLWERIKQPLTPTEQVLLWGAEKRSNMVAQRIPQLNLLIGDQSYTWDLFLAPIEDTLIIGLDFLKAHGGVINLTDDSVTLKGKPIQANMRQNGEKRHSVQESRGSPEHCC